MKKILAALLLLTSSAFVNAEVRKFTDTNGREIQAELIAVRGDQVEMKVGGKTYTLPISKFAEADVTFIKEWGEANPAPLKVRGMYIEIKKNTDKVKEPKANDDGKKKKDAAKISRTNFDYDITVRNTSQQDLPDLKLKYTIYKFVRERSDTGKFENLEETVEEEEISLLEKSSEFSTTTTTVMTTDSEESNKKAGTEKIHKETLWGVVVEVYHGDNTIRSGSSPDGLEARVKIYKASNE